MQFRNALNANVPAEIQRAIVDLLVAEYTHTRTDVKHRYAKPERRDVEPHIRRANIESALLELEERFPDKVSIKTGATSRSNGFRYLICGNLVLTQSYVEHNRRVPREAAFRNGFAGDPKQYLLFPEAEAERLAAVKVAKCMYVIITHSPSLNNPAEPAHVTAVFVDKHCQHLASIDLVQNVTALMAKDVAVERVEDRRHVALRKDVTVKRKAHA